MSLRRSTGGITYADGLSVPQVEERFDFSFVYTPLKIALRYLLSRLPPSVPCYVNTVLFRAGPLRRLVLRIMKCFIPATMDFRGNCIALNQDDAIVSGSLALGSYETFVTDVLEALLKPGMTFFDVGANIGIYTALAARLVGPTGRVIAIEPETVNVAIIRKTVRLNAFANVRIEARAAGDSITHASLYVSNENPADHRLHDSTGRRGQIRVAIVTLDALAAECGVEHADVIKIDTQGWEAAVFAGMPQLLAATSKPIVVTEFWPWGLAQAGSDPRALLDHFVASGLQIYEIDSDRERILPRRDLDQLAALKLERQHVNLLLCQNSRAVEDLQVALMRSRT
jgi:FkbM family methyltransferase